MNRSDISAKVREAFNFTIDKFPLSGPDNMRTPFYGLFRSDKHTVVGSASVTHVYTPHTTDDVVALVEAAGEAFDGDIDARFSFNDGHYVSVQPSKDYRRKIAGTDTVWPRVLIRAGYDGQAFRASMGYYRDMCRNLAIMRQVEGTSVAIRHTGGLRAKMDDLIQTFNRLKNGWGTLADVINQLHAHEVVVADFLNAIYGEPGDSKRSRTMHQNRTEAIIRRLQREAYQLGNPFTGVMASAWLAFNAVQGYAQHDQNRHGTPSEFDRMLMAQREASVSKAEELALATLTHAA